MTKMIATRNSYGETLKELGDKNKDIVVLDADLSGSTKTSIFKKAHPERFFNVGIAEQNLMATAAGLATAGKIPFASTFAMFATGRAFEIIRNSICYPNLNVKIAATHAGLTVGEDGATHQALEDISIMRSLPNMVVLSPCDAVETKQCILKAADHNGPVYIRLGRSGVPVIFDESYEFEIGKANELKERLLKKGVRVIVDDTNASPGWKFHEHEMKGIPLRIELGPRDIENNNCVLAKRNDGTKCVISLDELEDKVLSTLEIIHGEMLNKAQAYLDEHTTTVYTKEELGEVVNTKGGYAKMMWCGNVECENVIKEEFQATSRCMPFTQQAHSDKCAICGKEAKYVCLFAKAY